jgi:hypothetical protein
VRLTCADRRRINFGCDAGQHPLFLILGSREVASPHPLFLILGSREVIRQQHPLVLIRSSSS